MEMTRSRRILGLLAAIGLIVMILAQTTEVNAQGGRPYFRGNIPPGPLHVSRTFSYAVGIPAIHPRTVSSSSTPSFTVEDVSSYVLTTPLPGFALAPGAHLHVQQVLLVSSKEATQLMKGESPGLADNALVYFVLLKGPFDVQIDPPPGTSASTDQIATEIGVVFDAHTGNLLEWEIVNTFPKNTATNASTQPAAQVTAPDISYDCDPTHCWATNYWPNQVNGAETDLNWCYPDCTKFYYGDQSEFFAQNSMWLVDKTEEQKCSATGNDLQSWCWVEAGLRAYYNADCNCNQTALFWADVRPGEDYAPHYGPVINTLSNTYAVVSQIWKAGTIPNVDWCPTAADEWCVELFAEPGDQTVTAISGEGNTNSMTVSAITEGLEIFGTGGAKADYMYFDYNQWESDSDNSWHYQEGVGDKELYKFDSPADGGWNFEPAPGDYGGEWFTCITGEGC